MSTSQVESHFLKLSGRQLMYSPLEKVGVVEVPNFPALGKLTALRFIEWVQANPGGVISLPTGKTPEHFIKWVIHYLSHWGDPDTITELASYGVDTGTKPQMETLYFVQMDDFYPISPTQHNCFQHYVNRYYVQGFGLDPQRCLLIDTWAVGCPPGMTAGSVWDDGVDLTLRCRKPTNKKEEVQQQVLAAMDQYCSDYERKIRDLGGVGFFLGGIGPDGHVAFNIRGSDHYCTTRLTTTNYETQAAAAGDLGGIELARKTLVVTIGLSTITSKQNVVAIVAAAGEAKAGVVADSIQQERSNQFPGSVLHGMPNARFYLTQGACVKLVERQYQDLLLSKGQLTEKQRHRPLIDLSMRLGTKIRDLTVQQINSDRFAKFVCETLPEGISVQDFLFAIEKRLIGKIELSLERMHMSEPKPETRFMHTAPHHDDIILGYLPYAVHLLRPKTNSHTFNYMTSGFNAVTNTYVVDVVADVKLFLPEFAPLFAQGYFDDDNKDAYHRDLYRILDGFAARDKDIEREGVARRIVRIIATVFGDHTQEQIASRCDMITTYIQSRYPGQKDTSEYQRFKGLIRELEADLVWGTFGFNEFVNHLRLGFYKGDYFTEVPTTKDAEPVLEVIRATKPHVVTVAFDPEGSGPDTHYKVMQAVCQALRMYKDEADVSEISVWGYRNVWYRYHPAEADLMVPVSLNSMRMLDDIFNNCFGSQRSASFPAHEYDGPFSRLATRIQAEQLQMIKTCLGPDYFEKSELHLLKRTHGLVFLRTMTADEFFAAARDLETAVGPPSS